MTELTIIPSSGTALPAEPFRARHLIDGAWTDSADGAVSEKHSPAHGATCSASRQRAVRRRPKPPFGGGAPSVFDRGRLAPCVRQGPVGDLAENRRSDRTRHRPYRADRDTGIGQADYAGAGRDFRRGRPLALCGGAGATMHGESHNSLGPDMLGLVLKEPVGTVAGIICPWNFPFLIVSQKTAPSRSRPVARRW